MSSLASSYSSYWDSWRDSELEMMQSLRGSASPESHKSKILGKIQEAKEFEAQEPLRALKVYEKVLPQVSPDDLPDEHYQLVEALIKNSLALGQFHLACCYCEEWLFLYSHKVSVQHCYGYCLVKLGRLQEGVEALKKALGQSPNDELIKSTLKEAEDLIRNQYRPPVPPPNPFKFLIFKILRISGLVGVVLLCFYLFKKLSRAKLH